MSGLTSCNQFKGTLGVKEDFPSKKHTITLCLLPTSLVVISTYNCYQLGEKDIAIQNTYDICYPNWCNHREHRYSFLDQMCHIGPFENSYNVVRGLLVPQR